MPRSSRSAPVFCFFALVAVALGHRILILAACGSRRRHVEPMTSRQRGLGLLCGPALGLAVSVACLALFGLLAAADASAERLGTVTEFSVGLSPNSEPSQITKGPDGNMWFTEPSDRIGRITPSGQITEYSTGITPGSDPFGIAAGSDGNLWFTEASGKRIGRITPAGQISEFSAGIPANSEPYLIAAGPDGNLWFTDAGTRKIGRITTSGVVTEFATGMTVETGDPAGIAAGPDGNLWFAGNTGGPIGRITPDGTVTEFRPGPDPNEATFGITGGPDGNIWFTSVFGGIGRITPSGEVSEFTEGIAPGSRLGLITAAPDGNLWFTETEGNRIGRITPAGTITQYSDGISKNSVPFGIAAGPEGDLWFTEEEGNRIARITSSGTTEEQQREEEVEAIEREEEEEEQEKENEEGYGRFVIESYGPVSGTLDVRNPPGTHLEDLTGEEIDEAGLPPGSVAVVGGVSYSLQGLPAGTSVNAKFFLPQGSNPTNVFKKIKGEWVDVTYLATISGNEITFHVRDGGPGDEDGVANGVIVDPMVPVRLSSPPSRSEVGRCQAGPTAKEGSKTIYLGDHSDSKCSKSVPDTGKYKWKPGFDKGAFALSGTKTSLETADKTKISCTALSGAGEYTGATGESLTITLSGCMNSGKAKCQSSGHPEGQIISSLLGGPIGYVDAAKGTVGVDLAPIAASEPDFADFQCAGTAERLTGSLVGQVKTVGKPSSAIEVQFKAKKGLQSLQSLEGAPPDTLSLLSGSAPSEAIGLTTKLKQTGEEPLEVKEK
jgi:streptogramin lyase